MKVNVSSSRRCRVASGTSRSGPEAARQHLEELTFTFIGEGLAGDPARHDNGTGGG